MSIITQGMLENRVGGTNELIRLTDDDDAGAVNADVLAQYIADGEGEILAYVGQRYTLPLQLTETNTAALVRAKLLDAIVYRLYMHRDHRVDETIETAYRDAVKWGEAIAKGTLGLVGETAPSESPAGTGTLLISSGSRLFSRDALRGL